MAQARFSVTRSSVIPRPWGTVQPVDDCPTTCARPLRGSRSDLREGSPRRPALRHRVRVRGSARREGDVVPVGPGEHRPEVVGAVVTRGCDVGVAQLTRGGWWPADEPRDYANTSRSSCSWSADRLVWISSAPLPANASWTLSSTARDGGAVKQIDQLLLLEGVQRVHGGVGAVRVRVRETSTRSGWPSGVPPRSWDRWPQRRAAPPVTTSPPGGDFRPRADPRPSRAAVGPPPAVLIHTG
jgi:hypothetical protein